LFYLLFTIVNHWSLFVDQLYDYYHVKDIAGAPYKIKPKYTEAPTVGSRRLTISNAVQ